MMLSLLMIHIYWGSGTETSSRKYNIQFSWRPSFQTSPSARESCVNFLFTCIKLVHAWKDAGVLGGEGKWSIEVSRKPARLWPFGVEILNGNEVLCTYKQLSTYWKKMQESHRFLLHWEPEVRSHALRALAKTIYDLRCMENVPINNDLRSLLFWMSHDLRSMIFNLRSTVVVVVFNDLRSTACFHDRTIVEFFKEVKIVLSSKYIPLAWQILDILLLMKKGGFYSFFQLE